MNKIINFVKENKIYVVALAVVALCFVLFAIPGYAVVNLASRQYSLSGYQFFFNTEKSISELEIPLGSGVVGSGIAIFVMLILAIPALIFSKKSSFVSLLTGLELLTVSILFFCSEKGAEKSYGNTVIFEGENIVKWIPYFLGALVLIAAGLVLYKTFMVMKDEIKHPTSKTQGPTYNYLKK